jgi:hypothetical protein
VCPRFAPSDVLAETPSLGQLKQKERKEAKRLARLLNARDSGAFGGSEMDSRGTSMTSRGSSMGSSSAYSSRLS